MSGIVPPAPIPEPEGEFHAMRASEGERAAASPYEQLQSRRRTRRVLVAALSVAVVGMGLLLAGPAAVGAALLLPGLAGALIAESRLSRLPRPVMHYGRPPYGPHEQHSWFHFSDFGSGDCGGGGGDGGGG
jgi:hypothetical protein